MSDCKMKKIIQKYIVVFSMIAIIYCSINGPLDWGEYDDYTLPIASILNDHNFEIDQDDLDYYERLFPERADIRNHFSLSGYNTPNGEMTWYFPTYAIVNLPMVLLMRVLDLPASYGLMYTNIVLIVMLLYLVYKSVRISFTRKFLVILSLSINPIFFYLPWMLGEAMIFAFLGMAMIAWYNGWNKRAAILLSLAGTLNVVVMAVGFFMIFDYLYNLYIQSEKKTFVHFVRENILKIVLYGMCYIPGIIPLLYNMYYTGHINLTASYSSFTQGKESVFERFRAYFIDLNYGYIPYYGIILIIAISLFVIAIKRKHCKYIESVLAFTLTVFLYSIMTHINCGGSGIARYSSWGAVILVSGVVLYYDEILIRSTIKRIAALLIYTNILVLAIIIITYGPYAASKTWSTGIDPIARYVLDKYPSIYNPLKSSFYASVNNVIGGYDYDTPVVYSDKYGHVRKILASDKDAEYLKHTYGSLEGNWFEEKINELNEKEEYISVPVKYAVIKKKPLNLEDSLCFRKDGYNAGEYINTGIYSSEEWGSWSSDSISISMELETDARLVECSIECGVYNQEQQVVVFVNGTQVFSKTVFGNEGIRFEFAPDKGITEIRIEVPSAVNEVSRDGRVLGLSIGTMSFAEKY